MSIDPKKIAEWRADPPGCDCTPDVDDDCACPARKAVPVLLAEREEMLAEAERLRGIVERRPAESRLVGSEGQHLATYTDGRVYDVREMLALLREAHAELRGLRIEGDWSEIVGRLAAFLGKAT